MEETHFYSPIGVLKIAATKIGVSSVRFTDLKSTAHPSQTPGNPHLSQFLAELDRYFSGEPVTFKSPADPVGTDFQKKVWQRLAAIPFGSTKTYGQIAREIGQPNASRAVGGANNRNALPILIPCHRVIGSRNALVGFAGGLWRKQWMLEHEGIALPLAQLSNG